MHQLDASAKPFDPLSNCIAGQMDTQFILFSRLQLLNTTMKQLQHQMNTLSIPTLKQINQRMMDANLNQYYIINPVFYLQLQQQQNNWIQIVQFQQSQSLQLEKEINKTQSEYQTATQQAIQTSLSVNEPEPKALQLPQTQETKDTDKELPVVIAMENDSKNICEPAQFNNIEEEEKVHEKVAEIKYSISDLLEMQPKYRDINWLINNNQCIPRDIRIIYQDIDHKEFMTDIVASISRKCDIRFSDRKMSSDKKEMNMKKLQGILNKMTPTKFDKIASETMSIISDYVSSKSEMEHVLHLILQFGTKQSIFSGQYAKLIEYLFDYLPQINENISATFRNMVIIETDKLFHKYNADKFSDKKSFIAFLKLCGDLYNVNMMHSGVIYKGIINELNNKISQVDIEAICQLFKECGQKLDNENTNVVDKYLRKIKKQAKRFDFRTKCLVDGIFEMRNKNWTDRIKKETPKQLDEIKQEFENEQIIKDKKIRKYDYNNYKNNSYEETTGTTSVRYNRYRNDGNNLHSRRRRYR